MTLALVLDGTRYVCTPAPQPGPDPEATPIRVIAYSQRDPRWAGQVYAGGETFGSAGCLVCCVAMIASLAYAEPMLPPDVARALRDARVFSGPLLSYPARIPTALNRLEWGGVLHYRNRRADMEMIARELSQYRATIAEVKWDPCGPMPQAFNQHFVVLTEIVGDDARIIDPWDGEEKLLSESRYRLPTWDAGRTIYGLRLVRPL